MHNPLRDITALHTPSELWLNYCFNMPQMPLSYILFSWQENWVGICKIIRRLKHFSALTHTTWPIAEQWASAMEDGEGGEVRMKSLGREKADNVLTQREKTCWKRKGALIKNKSSVLGWLQQICWALPDTMQSATAPSTPFHRNQSESQTAWLTDKKMKWH